MLRYIVTSLLALLLIACSTPRSGSGSSSREPISPQASASGEQVNSVTQALLGYAATDFRGHSPVVDRVRNVHVGHVLNAKGQKQYLLCGEFVPVQREPKDEWITFATIETDPYEQWLGAQAETWCKNVKVNWDEKRRDLSSDLQSRLGSLN